MKPFWFLYAVGVALVAVMLTTSRSLPQPQPQPGKGKFIGIFPGEEVPMQVFSRTELQAEPPFPWGVKKIGCLEAWKKSKGKGVKVAVLDTGCDQLHPDLVDGIVAARDFTGSGSGSADVNGHGTHCCGSVGARGGAKGGIWGVAPECSLIVAKVLGDNGGGNGRGIAAGIDWSIAQGADVISMSLGSSQPDGEIEDACRRAYAAGVLLVAAAGNFGPNQDTISCPGCFRECVCVTAVDHDEIVANFSGRGAQAFVCGPGVQVRSTYPGSRYATMSGTSMATPHLAGVAALWVAANPTVAKADRNTAFREAVKGAVLDLGPVGRDTSFGFGRIQADKLLGGAPALPPPEGKSFTLTEADLLPAALERFRAAYPGATLKLEIKQP